MTSEKGKLARVLPATNSAGRPTTDPALDNVSQKRIGDQLRAMYDDLVQQPVPDRFKNLLDELERKDRSGDPKSDRNP